MTGFQMIWLFLTCGCSSTPQESTVEWETDSQEIDSEKDTALETTEEEDTGTSETSVQSCSMEPEIQIESWTSPPAFGNLVHNQIEIFNPCPFPVVLLGSPQNWFENSSFSISNLPPNHIDPETSIIIDISFIPQQSGIFESHINIPTDHTKITSQTQIEVLEPLELVLVGDGGLRVDISNYGESSEDINIQYESLISTHHDFYDICFGNNRFVAVGGDQSGTENAHLALHSKQLNQDWNDHSKEDNPIVSCSYGDNFFVGISEHEQTPVHSLAGVQWQNGTRTPWMQDKLQDISFGNGVFIAVGNQGRISQSIDGTEWVSDISIGNLDLYKIIYEQNRFVAVGEFGIVISSENGFNWEEQLIGANSISHIVYGNDHFLLSNGMKIYRSSDTLIWEEVVESDLKLIAQIGSILFAFKGQDIYRCTEEYFEDCTIIATIPNGLQIRSAIFEERL
jgi:hypothetical protein